MPMQVSPVISDVVMRFDDCPKLGNSSMQVWQGVTTRFVSNMMLISLRATGMNFADLAVGIHFRGQTAPQIGNSTRKISVYSNRRSLQAHQLSPLDILFDVLIKLRSSDREHDWTSYFINTLNTKPKLVAYLKELSSSGDAAFGSINNVTVEIGGYDIAKPQPKIIQSKHVPSIHVALIACVVAGALIVTAVALFTINMFVFSSEKKKKDSVSHFIPEPPYDIEISLESPGDVSTLGGIWTLQSQKKYEDPTIGESTIKCTTKYQSYISGTDENQEGNSDKTDEILPANNNENVEEATTPSFSRLFGEDLTLPKSIKNAEPNVIGKSNQSHGTTTF